MTHYIVINTQDFNNNQGIISVEHNMRDALYSLDTYFHENFAFHLSLDVRNDDNGNFTGYVKGYEFGNSDPNEWYETFKIVVVE